MHICEQFHDPAEGGVSPHVWWRWEGRLLRLTDLRADGSIDFNPPVNLAAHYFLKAFYHLEDRCEECGRP